MKIKNMLIIAAAVAFTTSSLKAEHTWDWSMRDRFRYESDSKDLYAAQEFTLDLAAAYGVGKDKFNDTFDRSLRRDDSGRSGRWGASAGVNYFITRNFGIGADAWGLDNGGDGVDAASGSAILRFPIDVAHLAPYLFGGGGRVFDGPDSWTGHAGVGLEFRLNPRTGLFIDGRHIFLKRHGLDDIALIRSGLRFAF